MDHPISQILKRKHRGTGTNVPFLEPVHLHYPVLRSHQQETPNIKFPLVIQQGSLDIQLDNVGFGLAIFVDFLLLQLAFDLIDVIGNGDALAPISNFPWFDDVDVFRTKRLLFFDVWESFPLLYLLGPVFVELGKGRVLSVGYSVFDVESHWDVFERVALENLLVVFYVVKKRLLVSQVVVPVDVVVGLPRLLRDEPQVGFDQFGTRFDVLEKLVRVQQRPEVLQVTLVENLGVERVLFIRLARLTAEFEGRRDVLGPEVLQEVDVVLLLELGPDAVAVVEVLLLDYVPPPSWD